MECFIKRNLLFITQSDLTGADKVMIKFAEYLAEQGHNTQVLVANKTGHNPLVLELPKPKQDVKLGEVLNNHGTPKMLDRNLKYLFVSINENKRYQPTEIILKHLRFNPNIIVVSSNPLFLKSQDIADLAEATKAIVYNGAVDMSHFTGGCHFAWDCKGYIETGCKNCPAIKDEKLKYIAERNFKIKKELKEKHNFRVLCGTEWTKKQAQQSLLYKDQKWTPNISGIINPDVFFPENRDIAKKLFNLDENKFYILIGSENFLDERKGYKYVIEALYFFWNQISEKERKKIVVLSVGRVINSKNKDILFERKSISYINDERMLAFLYKASDVFINASIEDSGPGMLVESLACGTPVVSFKMGAAPEFIENGKTGFIAENKNVKELANGILKVFKLSSRQRIKLGLRASERVMKTASKTNVIKVFNDIFNYHHAALELYRKIEISVALCTYNGEKHLAEQLDSILNQNLTVDEIIVCDDNSIDSTWQILEEYQANHPKIIKIYQNKTNLGTVKNFEKAINLCAKEIVFLCDQDDVWFPHKTERVISVFKTQKGIQAVSHNLQICTEDKLLSEYTMWDSTGFSTYFREYQDKIEPLEYALFLGNMVTGAGFAFRKINNVDLLEGNNQVIHDYQLALKYIQSNEMYYLDECLGLYRQHDGQQIGAVLDKIIQHSKMVSTYCSANDFYWKFNFMKNRERTEDVFKYIKDTEDVNLSSKVKLCYSLAIKRYLLRFSTEQRLKIIASWLKNRKFSILNILVGQMLKEKNITKKWIKRN